MTTALNPSPWYSRLATYKRGRVDAGLDLAALTFEFLSCHQDDLASLLGGRIDLMTSVPSKRQLHSPEDQPLFAILRKIAGLPLEPLLHYRTGQSLQRGEYAPGRFEAISKKVSTSTVVLIEDTWVTGATATSAAGALLEAGAETVAILPIARAINDDWLGDHPYRAALKQPYDLDRWPRTVASQ